MTTTDAFLDALDSPAVKAKYPNPSIRNWRSRAKRAMISIDFMAHFLEENGYQLKQEMRWKKSEVPQTSSGGNTEFTINPAQHTAEPNEKMQLRKKLYQVRKQMNEELIARWFAWCKEEYNNDFPNRKLGMSESAFYLITSGRHISPGNTLFAIKALKEGKRIMEEYHAFISSEVEGL